MQNSFEIAKEQRRTIAKIIWSKVLDHAENATIRGMIANAWLFWIAAIGSVVLIFPEQSVQLAERIAYRQNAALLKTALSFLVVFNVWSWISLVRSVKIKTSFKTPGQNIEWIPVVELLDHLFEFQSFKRDDVEKKFWIPRNRFSNLANRLEELNVLVRGENNARILNPEFSRSDVANIFNGAEWFEDLKPVFQKVSENSWSVSPSKTRIIKNVKDWFSKKENVGHSLWFNSHKIPEYEETASPLVASVLQA